MQRFEKWKSEDPTSWFSCRPNQNGFLPVKQPLNRLPEKYDIINNILEEMKINKNGYLKQGKLGEIICDQLPEFDFEDITDKQLLAALLRDYCFMASAYSLEPCHNYLMNSRDSTYGLARASIPSNLSKPLEVLAVKNNTFPWLDYAHGYGLNNAVMKDFSKDPTKYDSYQTIRTFNGNESEQGFINVHVAMNAESGKLLHYQQECLENIANDDRASFNSNLQNHFLVFQSILATLQTMWKASKSSEYLTFRTFIMGQIGNTECFPTETITFERDDESKVMAFRGETGAQDSIIPSVDSFLDLEYPKNQLTEYLFDLRKYRPKDHQGYINFVKKSSKALEFKKYCFEDAVSCIYLLKNLNCLRMFRKKHWNLTKKYIIQNTNHPVATGGTPITTWLPNQLGATLEYMQDVLHQKCFKEIPKEHVEFFNSLSLEIQDHIQTVMDEVYSLQPNFNRQEHQSFLRR